MLRFWSSKLQFWRKSRRKASFLSFKASFLSFKASFLKEVSHKSFVFELHCFNFEGSLAEMLRFWSSKLRFWRKSRRNASFLSFKASFLKEVSHKSFVWQNNLNHTSVDNQLTWTSNHLTAKLLESQINWQPIHLNLRSIDNQLTWISNQLTTKSFESQSDWQPNQLNLKSTDNHLTWSANQQTTKIIWSTHRLTTKSFESQIDWQPNLESDINWLSNQLSSTHPLPIGSLSLETSATALCGRYVIYNFISYNVRITVQYRELIPVLEKCFTGCDLMPIWSLHVQVPQKNVRSLENDPPFSTSTTHQKRGQLI